VAKVNTKGKDNATALHVVSIHDHQDIVELLLETGAGVKGKFKSPVIYILTGYEASLPLLPNILYREGEVAKRLLVIPHGGEEYEGKNRERRMSTVIIAPPAIVDLVIVYFLAENMSLEVFRF